MARRPAMFGAGVRGRKELLAAFDEFAQTRYERVVFLGALRKAAAEFAKKLKADAPKRTGELSKKIKVGRPSKTASKRRGASFRVGTVQGPDGPGFRAHFGEYGTSKEPPRPWFRPAWAQAEPQIRTDLTRHIWNHLRGMARRWRRKAESGKASKAQRRALLR